MMFLALRNVARSWAHHGPVALYFGLALALVMVGQGFLDQADRNLRTVYPGALTGDVLVRTTAQPRWTLFGSAEALWGDSSLAPVLTAGDALKVELADREGVTAVAGVVAGPALADLGGSRQPVWVFGVDADAWAQTVPDLKPDQPWGPGAFLSPSLAQELGSPAALKLLYSSGQDFQIVAAPVQGQARAPVPLAALDHTLWLDAPTARHLFGRETAPAPVPIAQAEADLLSASEDDLFGSPADNQTPEAASAPKAALAPAVEGGAAWNFLLVRLADAGTAEALAAGWTAQWRAEGRGLEAVTWREASGGSSLYVVWLQGLLAAGLVLLGLIGAGSLVNAMTGIVVERTAEVGTLRALGASRGQVYRLFGLEALAVVGVGALAALTLTAVVAGLLAVVPLTVPNAVFAALVGGHGLAVSLSPALLAADLGVTVVLAWGATVLPLAGLLGQDVVRSLERTPE